MAIPAKKSNTIVPRSSTFWLLPILLFGAALRFYHATAVALWHDEAFSALYLHYSWPEMFYRITLDVHPPLYYVMLRLWNYVFGWGLLSLRGFSIFFGILAIYAGYLFVKAAFKNDKLAILAALFLAVNPFQIQYSQEARMYPLGVFLVLLSCYLLVKALETNKTSVWFYYSLAVAASFYTHYYLFFSVAAQGLYFLYYIWKEKKMIWKGWGAYLLSVVLFLPWVPTLLVQIRRVDGNFWIPAPDQWSVPGTIWAMAFGGQGIDHITAIVTTLVAIGIIAFFFTRAGFLSSRPSTNGSEPQARVHWLVILSLIVPFILALLLSFKQAIYQDRYFVFASVFFSIIIATSIYLFPKFSTRKYLTWLFVLFSLFIFVKNWRDLGLPRPGMAGASAFINSNARPQDRIYVGSSFVYFTFKYYNHTPIAPELISSGPLSTIPHFSGTALLNPSDLILTDTMFNHPEVKTNDTVWLLWTTGFGSNKPNVPGNWSAVTEQSYSDTPGYKGNIYVTEYHVN